MGRSTEKDQKLLRFTVEGAKGTPGKEKNEVREEETG